MRCITNSLSHFAERCVDPLEDFGVDMFGGNQIKGYELEDFGEKDHRGLRVVQLHHHQVGDDRQADNLVEHAIHREIESVLQDERENELALSII